MSRPDAFPIELAPGDAPLFLRVARALSDEMRRGRLAPGSALPGTRSLAERLGVHRNTVLAAFRELESEGWIRAEPARGTFVSAELPVVRPVAFSAATRADGLGFDLSDPVTAPVERGGRLVMSGGLPDLRLVPVEALAREYRRALRRTRLLGYGDPRGEAGLRGALATHLAATRGLAIGADDVLVTRGTQMALDLLARVLVRPGDAVAVEALGYPPARDAFRRAGAELVPVPVDDDGIDVDALARAAEARPIRAVYVTPHHQYPTTVTLPAGRRLALLDLARRHRMAVIEDDYDHEFHYDGRPVLPLASADDGGVVIYVGTLSKILAPTLRVGYVVAPRRLLDALAGARATVDLQGDRVLEAAIGALFRDGEIQRHGRRMKRIYQGRRDLLANLLRDRIPGLSFAVPSGGMALWVRSEANAVAWAARAAEQGVVVFPGAPLAVDGHAPGALRLGFAPLDPGELRAAVTVLAATR